MHLLATGFHPAPSRRRPIQVAHAVPSAAGARLEGFEECAQHADFTAVLARCGPWLGVFDFPFGLAREVVVACGWPLQWDALATHVAALGREAFRAQLRAFCTARPRGARLPLRATERASGAPPALGARGEAHALRFRAGAPALCAAGVTLPGVRDADPLRIALEGSPALLAASVTRGSWRSARAHGRADVRELERERVLDALERGHSALGVRLRVARAERRAILADDRGERLAALLCLAQAAWAAPRADFGLAAAIDPIEGWTVAAHLPPTGGRPKMAR